MDKLIKKTHFPFKSIKHFDGAMTFNTMTHSFDNMKISVKTKQIKSNELIKLDLWTN